MNPEKDKWFIRKWFHPDENELRTAIITLRGLGWSKERIAKHLGLFDRDVYKVYTYWRFFKPD